MLSKNYFEQGKIWIINHVGKMYNGKEYTIQNGTISVDTCIHCMEGYKK